MMARRSREQILSELFVGPRQSFVPLIDSIVIAQPGWWQLITPSFRNGGLNEVALSVLSADKADGVIERTEAMYARLGLLFRWAVTPESAPSDLAARLARRGFEDHPTAGVVAEVAGLVGHDLASSVEVLRVDLASEPMFTNAMADGWGVDRQALGHYHRALLTAAAARTHMFVARVAGCVAGAASYVAQAGSAFFIGGIVMPEFRGRGVYRTLVQARARHAHALGLTLAASHAGSMSTPILLRMGFEEACRFSLFTSPPAK